MNLFCIDSFPINNQSIKRQNNTETACASYSILTHDIAAVRHRERILAVTVIALGNTPATVLNSATHSAVNEILCAQFIQLVFIYSGVVAPICCIWNATLAFFNKPNPADLNGCFGVWMFWKNHSGLTYFLRCPMFIICFSF